MELTYQGLKICLPIEGVVEIESFEMDASFNAHAFAGLVLLMEEERIQKSVHGIKDGDGIKVYEKVGREILFAGKIVHAKMRRERGLCLMELRAASYTVDWEEEPVSQSFLDLGLTYLKVMKKVLKNQPGAKIIDCVTNGAKIPDFLLQYEESDWDFLVRLASHFYTFLVPDYKAGYGRVYFGIPDTGKEILLKDKEYKEIKDMDQHYRVGSCFNNLPQESMKWELTSLRSLDLADKVKFQGIETIVTKVSYKTVDGALVRTYELSRKKGVVCVPKKNPNIFGMSIPATVKERSGNCVRVHFHIDEKYEASSKNRYFTYAVESSFIYCMPEVGSQVHIYFPGDDEGSAVAVHALRASAVPAASGAGSGAGYAQIPDNKSFSNVNGAELMLTPGTASMSPDQSGETCVTLDTEGNANIAGNKIDIHAEKNLIMGEPGSEGGNPVTGAVLEAGMISFQIGKDGASIDLSEEVKVVAAFVRMEASDRSPADPAAGEVLKNITEGDAEARNEINQAASDQLVAKYDEGKSQILNGAVKVLGTAVTMIVAVGITVGTGGGAAPIAATLLLGAGNIGFGLSDMGEGVDNVNKAKSGDLSKGHNFLRDDVIKNDKLYDFARFATDVAFGFVSGAAIGKASGVFKLGRLACGSEELIKFKTAFQVGGNVLNGLLGQLATTGKIDPLGLAANFGIGLIQGILGTTATNSLLNKLGLTGSQWEKLAKALTGTVVDTGIDALLSKLLGQDFNLWDSLARNAFVNALSSYISDPVDAVTGAYAVTATDFIIASVPKALELTRTYSSTNTKDSVLGRGWSFPCASRIYLDTGDTENTRVHLEAVTGHSLCFKKEGEEWVNQCRGTARFSLKTGGVAAPEQETFLLSDVIEHTLCAYDSRGRLSYVEYPSGQKLEFTHDEEGLKRIATPLGNILEVESRQGRILGISDEIGRRVRYRYEGDLLVDVVHMDEGITHYEYDEGGHIMSVTDQNGSRYLENEYDKRGRVVRQGFPGGVYQTFDYDDAHRKNRIYY
ncbi:MAG: DUF6531 domain-containing protein, partial [Roseburia sp.]|nr:DUF6531 domain-containing protein [Roseburia sp.]